jgi:hypothetical protein
VKPSSTTTQLDDFIREKLKAASTKLPLVDWAEVEILLGTQKQPISFSINKKIIKPILIITTAIIIFFGAVKLIPVISNALPKKEPENNSVQESTITPNTTLTPISSNKIIPTEVDSLSLTEQKTDSVLKAAEELSKKINGGENLTLNKTVATASSKKKKEESLKNIDSSTIAEDEIVIPPAQDTANIQKTIQTTELTPVTDSVIPNIDTKSKKAKKGKNKKNTSDSSIPEKTKSDSLK